MITKPIIEQITQPIATTVQAARPATSSLPTPDATFLGPYTFSDSADVTDLTGVQPPDNADWTLLLVISPTTAATSYELLGISDNNTNYVLVMAGGSMYFAFGGFSTGVTRLWPHSAGWSWSDATYKHLGIGWDDTAGEITMWEDGTDKGQGSLSAPVGWPADASLGCTRIVGGNRTASNWTLFDGDMKNIKYFNSLLTTAEVADFATADT